MTVTVLPRTTSGGRNLNSVQRTLRSLIWFLLFGALAILTVIVAALLGAFRGTPWGIAILIIGGFLTLIIPGMVTRCLYVIPSTSGW